jgi:hypothetical protein
VKIDTRKRRRPLPGLKKKFWHFTLRTVALFGHYLGVFLSSILLRAGSKSIAI